jgi:heme oxygenase
MFWATKTHHNKFKKTEIIQCLLSDFNEYRKMIEKSQNMWRLYNMLLSSTWIKEGASRMIIRYLELNKIKTFVLFNKTSV